MLKGYKTYILAGVGAAATFCFMLGWINAELYQLIMSAVGLGTVATLRHAIANK